MVSGLEYRLIVEKSELSEDEKEKLLESFAELEHKYKEEVAKNLRLCVAINKSLSLRNIKKIDREYNSSKIVPELFSSNIRFSKFNIDEMKSSEMVLIAVMKNILGTGPGVSQTEYLHRWIYLKSIIYDFIEKDDEQFPKSKSQLAAVIEQVANDYESTKTKEGSMDIAHRMCNRFNITPPLIDAEKAPEYVLHVLNALKAYNNTGDEYYIAHMKTPCSIDQ